MKRLPAIRKVIAAHLIQIARLDDLTREERQMLVESYLDEVYQIGRRRIPHSALRTPHSESQ